MTNAKDIKAGMKFDNCGDIMTVVSVTYRENDIIIQWDKFYGNEFLAKNDAINMPRA